MSPQLSPLEKTDLEKVNFAMKLEFQPSYNTSCKRCLTFFCCDVERAKYGLEALQMLEVESRTNVRQLKTKITNSIKLKSAIM